jgi:hypothetical protein
MKFAQPPGFRTLLLAMVLFSCHKSNDVTPPPPTVPVNTFTDKLEACIKFDNTLVDSVNKAATGVVTGTTSFVNDRKGNASSALFLDGASKVNFTNVNFKGKEVTMSAWLKFFTTGTGLSLIVNASGNNSGGMALFQLNDTYGCAVSVPSTNSTEGSTVSTAWHHVASTYNGTDIKVYIDGVLVNTMNHPGSIGEGMKDVMVGFFSNSYWKGSIDELRIYSKVLSAGDIQQLAAQ